MKLTGWVEGKGEEGGKRGKKDEEGQKGVGKCITGETGLKESRNKPRVRG